MIKELDNNNFHEEINHELVLVDFYATWCGPCKMMHPIVEEIAKEHSDLKVIKVNVDLYEDVAREYGIMSIPTLILFQNGEMKEKNIGFMPKEALEEWIIKNK